jgi:gamma-glutamyl:cysteine ligase YbdK (ATP-grasp superfamily)
MSGNWHLFEAFGVELEYMLVDAETLDVLPEADQLIRSFAGEYVSDVERGEIAWSNELCLHVLELKTNGPAADLPALTERFQQEVEQINSALTLQGGRLMPTAMHPWMDPTHEMKLWPHDFSPIYQAFDSIFDCRGHGWANLQSTHINLPFSGDDEFGRLHAAIRLVLPLLPAIAASSPIAEGRITGKLDSRLDVYRTNAQRVPSVSGWVVPEQAFDQSTYETDILQRVYRDIAPFDPAGILQDEFLNARGAIARFSRGSIEIRVLDIQECPRADIAICETVVGLLKLLVSEHWTDTHEQRSLAVEPLHRLLLDAIDDADGAVVTDEVFLRQFGLPAVSTTMSDIWRHIVETLNLMPPLVSTASLQTMQVILDSGPLSRRILRRLGDDLSRPALQGVYRDLCDCLSAGTLFE